MCQFVRNVSRWLNIRWDSRQMFCTWVQWTILWDSKARLSLIRAHKETSHQRSEFWLRLLYGKMPPVAFRAPTQRLCWFLMSFFFFFCWTVKEYSGSVCLFVHYSKSLLWMKSNVNLTSVQNENVGQSPRLLSQHLTASTIKKQNKLGSITFWSTRS